MKETDVNIHLINQLQFLVLRGGEGDRTRSTDIRSHLLMHAQSPGRAKPPTTGRAKPDHPVESNKEIWPNCYGDPNTNESSAHPCAEYVSNAARNCLFYHPRQLILEHYKSVSL
jgi:hypothetical protein